MTPKELYYDKRAQILIRNLRNRHFGAYYCKTKEEALTKWAKWADKDERNLTMKPERKGKWIRISIDKYTQHAQAWYRCSVCGAEFIGEFNYCGHCGASMRGDNHV